MNPPVSPFGFYFFISLIAEDLYQMEEGGLQTSSSFNCNICLDSVSEPVVTMCGHLYCRSCIYDWLHRHHPATGTTCPTCKSPMSDASLIPLYGQGSRTREPSIPDRPFLMNCTRSRWEEDHHLVMSNSNYGTWVNDGNFRNYCGLVGFAIGLKYDCPYRRLNEYGAREGIWIEIWLRLLFSVLLVFAALCALWF